jgi:hypothetical protein
MFDHDFRGFADTVEQLAKSLAASASEMWITSLVMIRFYVRYSSFSYR